MSFSLPFGYLRLSHLLEMDQRAICAVTDPWLDRLVFLADIPHEPRVVSPGISGVLLCSPLRVSVASTEDLSPRTTILNHLHATA
jgi:hypothetical protein